MSPETWAQHMDAEAQRLSAYVVGFVLPVLVPQNPIGGEIVPPEAHLGGREHSSRSTASKVSSQPRTWRTASSITKRTSVLS